MLDLFLSFVVAESIMMLVSSVVPVAIVGIALGAMVYGGFMIVQGFFIKVENIGWWWRWMHWIGMHSYSFSAFMQNGALLCTGAHVCMCVVRLLTRDVT